MYERPGRISLKIYAVVTVAMCSFDGAKVSVKKTKNSRAAGQNEVTGDTIECG